MSRWQASLLILGCLASPLTPAADSLECIIAKAGWTSQRESGDLKAAARSFATLVRKCESAMQGSVGSSTPHFIADLRGPELRDSRLEALEALFDSNYRYGSGEEPSYWWSELVQRRLEKKDAEGARSALARIDGYGALLSMRLDRRFDELRAANPERFDVQAAQRTQLARLRARVDANPLSLAARCELAWGLRAMGRQPDALAVMDSALAAGEQVFSDWKEQFPWALTSRGFVLADLGQHAQALELLRQADALTRDGEDRASFVINLALMQARLGKAAEALATLQRVGGTSDYGAMLVAHTQHVAYMLGGDHAHAEEALQRLRDKQHVQPGIYLGALLRGGQTDAAKAYLLGRLRDPDQRALALLEVQDYREPSLTPVQMLVLNRKKQLAALPDVRQAILEVGRIESFGFPEP